MTVSEIIKFTNCFLADDSKLIEKDLFINTKLGTIIEEPEDDTGVEVINLDGLIISPGFIDIQINGCFGLDFSTTFEDADSKMTFVQNYNHATEKLLKFGVTSICPTVTSSFSNVYNDVLPILGLKTRSSVKADSLGAHIEGPFISPQKKGCHPPETLTTMDKGYNALYERYGKDFEKYTAILTAAPEIDGCLDLIPEIVKDDKIVFSIGHTMSDFETGRKAIESGASMMTHLFNAMPTVTARDVGVVGLISATNNEIQKEHIPYYGLVADGIHVHPSAIKLAYNANPDKAILVTDALYLIGCDDGIYQRGNQRIEKKKHLLHLEGSNTIAGSATYLLDCMLNLINWTDIPIEKALATITNNPSRSMNLTKRKGFLKPGCDADLNILTKTGELKQVYKLGNKVHQYE